MKPLSLSGTWKREHWFGSCKIYVFKEPHTNMFREFYCERKNRYENKANGKRISIRFHIFFLKYF